MTQRSLELDASRIDGLRTAVRGEVIRPEDSGYDAMRKVWLKGVDHRPQAIVRVADADDVARVVAMARDEGIELAVRSGSCT